MNAEYGWREIAGYYIAQHFETFLLSVMVLICGAILFEVLGGRWNEKDKDGDS